MHTAKTIHYGMIKSLCTRNLYKQAAGRLPIAIADQHCGCVREVSTLARHYEDIGIFMLALSYKEACNLVGMFLFEPTTKDSCCSLGVSTSCHRSLNTRMIHQRTPMKIDIYQRSAHCNQKIAGG